MEEEVLLFDQTMRKIEFLFRFAGINIKSGEQSYKNLKSRIIYVINFLWLSTDLAGGFYSLIDGIRTGKDFLDITYGAPCVSITTMATFKCIFLIKNEKRVHKLIENLRNLEIHQKKRTQSFKKEEIIKGEKKFLHLVLNTSNILFVVLILTLAMVPLVLIVIKYYKTNELEFMLMYPVYYPFDAMQIKVWPFVYLHQFWSASIDYFYLCSADLFFFVCCTYIRIQFRLLQHDLENIISVEGNTMFTENEHFKMNFNDLMKLHQDLIESANLLEVIYSKSTLINVVCSSLIICLTGFNVTIMIDSDLSFIMIFACFLLMSLVQIFFISFFADLLMSSSMDVSNAVYNSQWYTAEPKIGRKLLTVLTRSQIPCKITASGFADVNLNAFMRVLSTSYSYFALLQNMYGK